MHLPACDVSMREAFEAGFGGCPTYSTGYENHRYCHIDRDTISDLPVFGVCFECERCTDPVNSETPPYCAESYCAGRTHSWEMRCSWNSRRSRRNPSLPTSVRVH